MRVSYRTGECLSSSALARPRISIGFILSIEGDTTPNFSPATIIIPILLIRLDHGQFWRWIVNESIACIVRELRINNVGMNHRSRRKIWRPGSFELAMRADLDIQCRGCFGSRLLREGLGMRRGCLGSKLRCVGKWLFLFNANEDRAFLIQIMGG